MAENPSDDTLSLKCKQTKVPATITMLSRQQVSCVMMALLFPFYCVTIGSLWLHLNDNLVFICSLIVFVHCSNSVGVLGQVVASLVQHEFEQVVASSMRNLFPSFIAALSIGQGRSAIGSHLLLGWAFVNVSLGIGIFIYTCIYLRQAWPSPAFEGTTFILWTIFLLGMLPTRFHDIVVGHMDDAFLNKTMVIMFFITSCSLIALSVVFYFCDRFRPHHYTGSIVYQYDAPPPCSFDVGTTNQDLEFGFKIEVLLDSEGQSPCWLSTISWLVISLLFAGLAITSLLQTIDAFSLSIHISVKWISVVLLPIAGNGALLAPTIIAAVKRRKNISARIAFLDPVFLGLLVVPIFKVAALLVGVGFEGKTFFAFELGGILSPFFFLILFNLVLRWARSSWDEMLILIMIPTTHFLLSIII